MRNLALMWVLAACLLGCGGGEAKINDHWFGSYDIFIVYGEEAYYEEFYWPGQFISHHVTIHQDSCMFSGLGTQTFFTYLCEVRENRNELYLLYLKIIEGSDYDNFLPLDTVATLIKDGEQYYIKSPAIYDSSWGVNTKLLLNKEKRK
jgi:hypothetical protein